MVILWWLIFLLFDQSNAGLTFYQFGFFSLCQNNKIGNLTLREIEDARAYSQALEGVIKESINSNIEQRLADFPDTNIHGSIKYQLYDVCDDFEKLTSLVIEILIDEKYGVMSPTKEIFEPLVFVVYTHLPARMTSFVRNSFSFTKTYIHYLDFAELPDGTLSTSKFNVYAKSLLEISNILNVQDLFFISISESTDRGLYRRYYNMSITTFIEEQKCIQFRQYSPKELEKDPFKHDLVTGHLNPAFVLFSSYNPTQLALSSLKELYNETTNLTIFTHDIEASYSWHYQMPYPESFPEYFVDISESSRQVLSLQSDIIFNPLDVSLTNKTRELVNILHDYMFYEIANLLGRINTIDDMLIGHLNRNSDWKIQLNDYKEQIDDITDQFTKWNVEFPSILRFRADKQHHLNYVTRDEITQFPYDPEFRDENSVSLSIQNTCPKIECGPGRYKVYGEISGGYGWRCDLCPVNHYKSAVGDDGCLPCGGRFNIDNGKRTKCIDPYRSVYPEVIQITLFKSIFGLSSTGCLGTFITAYVFIWKRKTPVVISSDFRASMIHLTVMVCTFITGPALQVLHPSLEICITRVAIIGILYSLNICFMFVKSQKLLQAFLSKVPITVEEIRKTFWFQIVTVLTSILIVSALVVVTCKINIPFAFYLDDVKMERIYFCDTSFHGNVVIGFIIAIQFACFVQAFRGRHLPSVMNDGMALVYASFASIVMLIVMFAIGNFQKPVEKQLYQKLTVVINTFVIWFMMYGQKAIRMLLNPEQNTKRYFQEQRLTEMRERVDEKMRRSQSSDAVTSESDIQEQSL
eukprot:TCONS_00022413-protein